MTFVKEQQAELFAVFLAHFLMMHLVRFAHGAEIGIVQFVQPLAPTMNEHIVQHEVGEAVRGHAKSHPESKIELLPAEIHQHHRDRRVEEEKEIIPLKHAVTRLVMRLVQGPKKTMHHIFMRSPGYPFHGEIGCQEGKDIDPNAVFHLAKLRLLVAQQ